MKMNKIIGGLLAVAMLVSPVVNALPSAATAFAASSEEAAAMRKALEAVKGKADIPAEFNKFSSNAYGSEDNVSYSFTWRNEDGDASISITCDSVGRISYYNKYVDVYDDYRQKLPTLGKEEAQEIAEKFIEKIAPETVAAEDDTLTVSLVWGYGGSLYSVSFDRMKNGVKVQGNSATVELSLSGDSWYVSYAAIYYNYDAEFEAEAEKIEDAKAAYMDKFPAELIYKKQYNAVWLRDSADKDDEIRLVYRIKNSDAGYISAYTGEIIKENAEIEDRNVAMDAAAPEAAATGGYSLSSKLSEEELMELDAISNLYSAEDGFKFLKSIPMLKIDSSYSLFNHRLSTITQYGKDDKQYRLRVELNSKNEKKNNVYASFDAERKRLTSVSNYSYSGNKRDKELTDKEKSSAKTQISKFLDLVLSDKISEFEEVSNERYSSYDSVYSEYVRKVNGIPYINNTINVSYSVGDSKISSYSLQYDDDAEFVDPKDALDADAAYDCLVNAQPIIETYVYSDGMYRLVYTMEAAPEVDAFTGEDINRNIENIREISYSDISSHWCKEAVEVLVDYGIGLEGEEFMPETAITQADFLRLMVSGISGRYYITNDIDSIYNYCYQNRILDKSERMDDATISRETAFVYMIRLAGYEEVAKLSDIYKVSYSDGDKLSDGLIGYAAILSGMGIIAGDGGALRPKDSITRAETAVMLYRYMK